MFTRMLSSRAGEAKEAIESIGYVADVDGLDVEW
jgi:hypothetical protein